MVELVVNRFFETPLIRQSFTACFDDLAASIRHSMPDPEGEPVWHPVEADVMSDEAVQWAQQMTILAERFSADTDRRPPRHAWALSLAARIVPAGRSVSPICDSGAYWSAVLRLSGEAGAGGEMIAEDPRMPMRAMHEPGIAFQAPDGELDAGARVSVGLVPGDAVLMPGWLRCGINYYRGTIPVVELGLSLFARPLGGA
ncbi:MAG TPA: hypothetical protein VN047_07710 [Sphingopyxis sp.]|uniref:hypothetical protein n=1 Tax=Sphingopyxis sp. TaxID=1908224 RepID=UPI002C2FB987|nr:hypothetical protein [Sphingopyxis sp.]HWW56764.1 hypothetical protein [Sphingopyxis sp.]